MHGGKGGAWWGKAYKNRVLGLMLAVFYYNITTCYLQDKIGDLTVVGQNIYPTL